MDILRTTQIGRDAEYASRFASAVYPPPTTILIGDGIPPATVLDRLALTELVHQTGEFPIYGAPDRQIDAETGIETIVLAFILPADFAGYIREVGIKHTDGKLHRYTPFAADSNGFAKGIGYSQLFYVATLITGDEQGMATIRFAPMDTATISERIIERINTDTVYRDQLKGDKGDTGEKGDKGATGEKGDTTGTGNLILSPTIAGALSALAGQSVTLTASGSQYLWGGNTGITYRWTKSGVTTDGATLSVAAGESVSVIALDANGNTSPAVTRAVTVSLNAAPNVTALANTLPARLTRGTTYTYVLSGATDDLDAASTLQYQIDTAASSGINTLTTANGTNGKSRGFTVNQNATAVVIVVYVVDTAGLESARVTITRDNSQLDTPILSSGVLSSGTHTVNVPVGNYSITGNGGIGSMYVGSGNCETFCNEAGCVTYNCDENAFYPGAPTTVKNGSTLIQSFAGASSSDYSTLPASTTVVKQAAAALTLTVVVAASGGKCKIDWGM